MAIVKVTRPEDITIGGGKYRVQLTTGETHHAQVCNIVKSLFDSSLVYIVEICGELYAITYESFIKDINDE